MQCHERMEKMVDKGPTFSIAWQRQVTGVRS